MYPASLPPTTTSATAPSAYVWQAPQLTMAPDEVRRWWARIDADRQARKTVIDRAKRLLLAYLPPTNSQYSTTGVDDLKSNIHFRNTELKAAEVWGQFPDLILSPLLPLRGIPQLDPTGQPVVNPQTGQPAMASPYDLVAVKRALLNKLLDRDHANADLMVQESLFTIFQTVGVAATKICYESDVTTVPETPPTEVPGAILGLSQPPAPQPVVVNERWRWYAFSAAKLGLPSDFLSTDYDEAPYLFMEFSEPDTPGARQRYQLPPDFVATGTRDKNTLNQDSDPKSAPNAKFIEGVEVFLHAADFDPAEPNRDVFYRLVLIDGLKTRPAVYEFCPYQSKDAQGRLTFDSMRGNPIHPITLRVASDKSWIPPDAAFTDPLVQQEDTWARQDVQIRNANVPRFIHAASITEAIDKMKDAGTGQGVAVADEFMARGKDKLISDLPHLDRAQSDIEGRQQIQRMIAETLGIGSNQSGSVTPTKRSATENAIVQQNVSQRMQKERAKLLADVLRGVRKFDALVMRYMTAPGYVEILGQDGARRLQPFTNAHLQGSYAYSAKVDSQLSLEASSVRKEFTDFVNFFAKSGFLNMRNTVREGAVLWGLDPAEMVQDPPPPTPPPEKPSISFAFKGPDLAIPEVRAILAANDPKLAAVFSAPASPQAQLAAAAEEAKSATTSTPPHAGAAPKADLVDKHVAVETGKQTGPPPLIPQARPPGLLQ